MPTGQYDLPSQTKMNFCCITTGDPDIPVELPRGRNFALLKYGDNCQVKDSYFYCHLSIIKQSYYCLFCQT